jgi:hypothetical protein
VVKNNNTYSHLNQLKKKVYTFIHLFFIFSPFVANANYDFNTELQKVYAHTFKYNHVQANEILTTQLAANPKNSIAWYLKSLNETLAILLTDNPQLYSNYKKNHVLYLKNITKDNSQSPYYRFCLAEVYFHWATVQFKMGDMTNAAIDLKKSLNLLNQNAELHPNFVPTKKTLGLLNIILGAIPKNYQWLSNTLGYKGDIKKGENYLNEVIQANNIFSKEAQLYLICLKDYFISTTPDLAGMARLHNEDSNNPLITYLYAAMLAKHSKVAQAIPLCDKLNNPNLYTTFPFLNHLLGDIYLMAGSYEQSKTHYQTYLLHYKGKNFLKDVHYKLFVLYYISDQDQTAFNFWNKIPQTGNSIYESDKYAEQQYKYKSIPNKQLAKVRFFTDGGYYPQAFEILNKLYIDQLKSQKDKIEFYYRYARLYHKTANLSEAIDYYEKVIHINTTQTFYFAPNACLQLGYIYTYLKQNDKAKYYFNKAIEYKNHEYENSIEQKAKVALRALN